MLINYKKIVGLWSLLVIIPLILIFGFNYIVDPYSQNNNFNKKLITDDISVKFNFTKSKNNNTYLLSSSRGGTIDPELIENNLKNTKAINLSFGSASLDEMQIFINSIILNKNDSKYVFIGLDFFQFSKNWLPTRPISTKELLGITSKRNYKKNYGQYININTLKDSIETLIKNRLHPDEISCNLECSTLKKKGMRYYSNFINSIDYDIEAKVTNGRHYWHRESYDYSQVLVLKNILSKLRKNNITAFIYMNPITFQQIYSSDITNALANDDQVAISGSGASFFEQLNLIDDIVTNTDAIIYDFNNLNMVNLNNSNFLDTFHYNYKVADCIVNKISIGKSECGNDFGAIIDKNNIKMYKRQMQDKYFKLLLDDNLGFTTKKTEAAINTARKLLRKYQ